MCPPFPFKLLGVYFVLGESIRDHRDMIQNSKFLPSIIISDVPHMLAAHMNRQENDDFFNPHCGRVLEPTESNIKQAEDGNISVSINWLNNRYEPATKDLKVDGTLIHPVTLTTQRLSLYDPFHEGNTKQRKEYLRRTGQIRELAGLNTETAEQINSFMKNSISFVDCMSPIHHVLVVKAMLSQRNSEINKKNLGKREPVFDTLGRLISNNQVHSSKVDNLGNQPCSISKPLRVSSPKPKSQKIIVDVPLPSEKPDGSVDFNVTPLCSTNMPIVATLSASPNYLPAKNCTIPLQKDTCDVPTRVAISEAGSGNTLLSTLLYNIASTCWSISAIVAIRNRYGSGQLFEDFDLGLRGDMSDAYGAITDLKPCRESLSLCTSSEVLLKERKVCLTRYHSADPSQYGNIMILKNSLFPLLA